MASLCVLLLLLIPLFVCSAVSVVPTDCPVCERVIRASRELSIKQGGSKSEALEKYCEMTMTEVDEEKFCYNIATIKKDINRLLDLGADEGRICKKVKSINADFCREKSLKVERTGVQVNERFKRGIIYE